MTEKRMTFLGHVNELRNRLRISITVFLIIFFATFIFSNQVLNLFWGQFLGQYRAPEYHLELLANSVMSGFVTQLNLAFILAAAISTPLFIYEMFKFVEPALGKKHRTASVKIMLASTCLFAAGVLFVYFVMLPMVLSFFIQSNTTLGLANFFSVESFFSFIMSNLFIGGLIFQTPLMIVILNRLGVLPREWLVRSRRLVYVAIILIAGIITPDASVISQLILGGVMALLFEISMLVVK